MSKSIISNEHKCYICGTDYNIHKHHIYAGSRRKTSEKYGCWVYLCANHHNMSNDSVHMNKHMDLKLREYCQTIFEKKYPDKDFLKIFGINYL